MAQQRKSPYRIKAHHRHNKLNGLTFDEAVEKCGDVVHFFYEKYVMGEYTPVVPNFENLEQMREFEREYKKHFLGE